MPTPTRVERSLHRDPREVLVPALRRLEAFDLGRHRPRVQIVHDEGPRRFVDDDGMSLSQQLDLLLGIETLLRLREQALDPRVSVMAPVNAVRREACFA